MDVQHRLKYAVKILCVGEGDARSRILKAWDIHLNFLFHNKLFNNYPKEVKKDLDWIYKQLHQYEPVRRANGSMWKSSVQVTLERMINKKASKIAEKIYELSKRV